uniref:ABC-2 type transport system permease protein n=1 Tax=Candidatus Kentrum sp. FW TaxID=2126338 RepID=A0A450TFU9_9GAMM|nr:MAG: ABC-2 type transport system permease protein [Candidatus Kentron sp. FW]
MMRDVMHFEGRLLRADSTLKWLLVLFVAVVVYALTHGLGERAGQRALVENSRADQDARWLEYKAEAKAREIERAEAQKPQGEYIWGPRSPHTVGMWYGAQVVAEPPPLSALAIGQRDLYPAAHKVVAGKSLALGSSDALENPLALAAGHFDLAFVLLYLLPFLVLALSFDLSASERETGMLRMLLAQPVSLSNLVLGKVLARGTVIAVLVVAASLVGFLVAGDLDFDPLGDVVGRFALWLAAALLYAAFWFVLAVVVNAFGRSAAANAVTLATAWLVFVVLIPTLVNLAASSLYPVPSRQTFVAAMRVENESAQKMNIDEDALATFIVDHPELAHNIEGGADRAMAGVIRDEIASRQLAPVIERYTTQRDRQQVLIERLSYLSPTLLTHRVLLDVAGTGTTQQQAHLSQVRAFQRAWQAHFVPLLLAKQPFRPADYDSVPRFKGFDEPTSVIAWRSLDALLTLFFIGLLLAIIGTRLYGKYEIAR